MTTANSRGPYVPVPDLWPNPVIEHEHPTLGPRLRKPLDPETFTNEVIGAAVRDLRAIVTSARWGGVSHVPADRIVRITTELHDLLDLRCRDERGSFYGDDADYEATGLAL